MAGRVPHAQRITSRQHAIVKRCRQIASRRAGDSHILLDGEHLVDEALDAQVPLEVLLTDGRAPALVARAVRAGATIFDATAAVLQAASPVRSPSGVLAIANWSPRPAVEILATSEARVLALVDVQDPGNVGAVIRAADALGATGVLALGRTADPGGWKALRGAMGSTFRVAVGRGELADVLEEARRLRVRVVATTAGTGTALNDARLRAPVLVLLGNEGAGLPPDVADAADLSVTIPMRPGVNSLNVAVTAALVLYEMQRHTPPDARH